MNTSILHFIAWACCGISLAVSMCNGDWTWFARSGSLLTFVALLLAARGVIRQAAARVAMDSESESRKDKDASSWSFGFAALGTLIWGYGDLIGSPILYCGRRRYTHLHITAQLLNAIGLSVGIVGVMFLFIWGPPQPILETGVTYVRPRGATIDATGRTVADHDREIEEKRKRHIVMSRVGLGLVLVGFVFQLWAVWA